MGPWHGLSGVISVMKKPEVLATIVVLLFSCGCGTVPLLTTPTRHEKKVPAEYNLAAQQDKKVVVIVNNPVWVNAPSSLALRVAADVNNNLTEKLGLQPKNLVSNERLQTFRASTPEADSLSPAELGKAVGADLVLFAELHQFSLTQVTETEYYKGELVGRAAVFDCDSAEQLWPEAEQGKLIRVAFDVEEGDYSAADNRLAGAFAHCITRYLYDCPVHKFKIFEDKSGTGWEDWHD